MAITTNSLNSVLTLLLVLIPTSQCCGVNHTSDPQNWFFNRRRSDFNSSVDAEIILCVYPMRDPYTLLNRLLYYALILSCLVGHRHVWFIAAALSHVLAFSSIAAIHAIILAGTSRNGPLDLDVLGSWALVSVGCIAVLPVSITSKTIRESRFGSIFRLWGTLVSVGAVCSMVSIGTDERQYLSSNKELLTSPMQLLDPSFNCSYPCFSHEQLLRNHFEMSFIKKSLAFGHFSIIQAAMYLTGVFGLLYGLLICFLPSTWRKQAEPGSRETMHYASEKNSQPRNRRINGIIRLNVWKEMESGRYERNSSREIGLAILAYPALVIVMVLNEISLLAYGEGVSSSEDPDTIGQWVAWVYLLLGQIAATVVKRRETRGKKRQRVLDEEYEALQRREISAEDESQAGNPEVSPVCNSSNVDGKVCAKSGSSCYEEVNALGSAAANGNEAVVRSLLDKGVDVNSKESGGLTPLIRAAWAGRESVVILLLRRGATVQGWQGQAALTRASTNQHLRVMQILQERQRCLEVCTKENGSVMSTRSVSDWLLNHRCSWTDVQPMGIFQQYEYRRSESASPSPPPHDPYESE